jgi:hypothetical protein
MSRQITRASQAINRGVALVVFLVAPWQVLAQTPPDYESAFIEYAQVTKSYDTQKMSEFMHPEALRRFRSVMEAALHGPRAAQAEAELMPLFSMSSAAEFAKVTDLEAYRRMNDTIKKSSPELVEMMSTSTYKIVGSFVKDKVAYVTYDLAITVKGKGVRSQVVQKLKQHEGKWLLLLPSTAEASIAGIEARFQ